MKKLVLFLVFTLFIFSCQKDNNSVEIDNNQANDYYEVVLKERDPSMPLVLSKRDTTKNSILRSALTFRDQLGFSYSMKTLPIGSAENICYPVIDMKKLTADYPSYVTEKRIGTSEATSFAYSDFDRFTTNSTVAKKINSGFSLNLGLFSIGAKKKMEEVFTSSVINQNTNVYGELNIEVKESQYTIQTSSNIINKIKLKYLDRTFIEELYNTHPKELLKNYGGLVVTSFFTGGRATALYAGAHTQNETAETKEKNMNTDISASYGFDKTSASGELGIGKNYGNGSTTSNKIERLQTSVKTIGGSLGLTSFTIPKNVNDINLDLSSWVNSLKDKSTHSIIDITDEGLLPLSSLVLEKNLYERLKISGQENQNFSLVEPIVEIYDVDNSNIKNRIILSCLRTRFNTFILFDYRFLNGQEQYNQASQIIESFEKDAEAIFGMQIKYTHTNFLDGRPFSFREKLDTIRWKKFIDNETNTIYVVLPEKKVGLSIHFDYLLDTYGFRSYVNSLPQIQLTQDELLSYYIDAL